MAYKKPGAYARFVKTAGAVNNPASTKVMAIVGTGKLFFDVVNSSVLRQTGKSTDLLNNENVYEVHHVTSKPLKNGEVDLSGGGIEYVKTTHFELNDGKNISWKLATPPTVTETAGTSAGSVAFAGVVSASIGQDYLVETGQYRVEITYIDRENPTLGTYAVINHLTGEVLGEYQVGATPVSVIPGLNLAVTATAIPELDGDDQPIAGTNVTNTGDYVVIKPVAGVPVAGAPAAGSIYYVTYAYRKADEDFAPKVFSDYQDLVAEYGDYDVTVSGKVINSLALGAEIAFTNGVSPIVCVQAKNDSEYAIQRAIDLLEKDIAGVNNINTVIPLTSDKGVAAHAASHITNMSDSSIGKERMTYIGAEPGETYQESAEAAASFNNERVVYVVPGTATKSIRDVVTGKVSVRRVPGAYLALAVASLGLKNDPAEPLTNKTIAGFDGLGELYSESEKNMMAEKGCLVLEQVGSTIKVRHGQTTSVADVNSNEITLVQIKDTVIDAARNSLGAIYVGRKLLPTVVNDVQVSLTNILNQFKGQEIIIGYSNVSVKRSKDDPRAIDIKFEIEAVYPLNYINIEFSFSGVS